MINKKAISIVLFISLIFQFKLLAQQTTQVKGVVTDVTGYPLPGVSVLEQGTSNGVITDMDGNYEINLKGVNTTLEFSFLGFKKEKLLVGDKKVINVLLKEAATVLDELVVIGYGSVKKSDITGAIVSVKAEELQATSPQSLEQALQGRAAGVHVSTASAAPGGNSTIRIRGVNSLLANGDPLYIVDGFPLDSEDVSSINVQDISSVEVLKDASSTAIYGSRGANGVILITTSKSNTDKPVFNFSSNFGFQQISNKVELMNGEEFAQIFNEYLVSNGEAPYYDGSHRLRPTPENAGVGTDWFEQITKPGFVQSYNLAVQGGKKKNSYRISGAYYKHDGIVIGGDFTRYNLNLSKGVELTKWLQINTSIFLARTDKNGSGDRTGLEGKKGTINNAMKMSPVSPVLDENGNYLSNDFPGAQGNENPVAYANEYLNEQLADNIRANMSFNFKPFTDFSFLVKLGANVKHQQNNTYLSTKTIEGRKVGGNTSITNIKSNYYINENIASYKRKFNKHTFNFMAGFTMEKRLFENNRMTGTGLPSDYFSYAGIGLAETIGLPSVAKSKSTLMSYLARINYNFKDKYILSITNRTDGNSGFAEGKKWGNFPSASAAWRISNEDFLKDNYSLSDLKLRAGWGITGNSGIGTYKSLSLLANDRYVFGGETVSGIGPKFVGNSDLTWESTEMFNLGLDVGLFRNRITANIEAYYKYTTNMLMEFDIPSTSGYARSYINAGELENKGMEFSLLARVLTKKFKWTTSGNITFNRDKVVKLYGGQPLVVDIGSNQTLTLTEGKPVREFKGRKILGIFKDWNDVNSYTWTDPETGNVKLLQPDDQPGDIKYEDVNNDGKINNDDNIVYGSAFPDFTFGWNNQFKYQNFNLDVFLTGSQGNWVLNRNLAYTRNTQVIRNNLSKELVNRWTPENTDTNIPRLGSNNNIPNIEDASYVRIQNVKLSYNFPKKYLGSLQSLTVFTNVENLYVWTDYSGWDPDINTAYGGSENINIGQDTNSFPRPITLMFGFNFKF